MNNFILVFIGAGFGGGLRFLISGYIQRLMPVYFPFGTLAVNFIGSLILGILIFGFDDKELLSQNLKLLIGVGFCGGLTTFSTFSFETFNLLRDTEFFFAFINIFANLLVTILAVYISHLILK